MDWRYSEFIPNRAGVCPVHPMMLVRATFANGDLIGPFPAGSGNWSLSHPDRIMAYQFPCWEEAMKLQQIANLQRPVV